MGMMVLGESLCMYIICIRVGIYVLYNNIKSLRASVGRSVGFVIRDDDPRRGLLRVGRPCTSGVQKGV